MFNTDIFAKIATITGQEIDLEEVASEQRKNWKATEGDHIATLVKTAKNFHVTITPVRIKYFEALWKATEDLPIIFWSEKEQDWVLVTKSGLLAARIAQGDSPYDREKIFHQSLLKKLGLQSRRDIIGVGIVQNALPAFSSAQRGEEIRNNKDNNAKAGSHHGLRPEIRYIKMLLEDKKDILTLLIFSIFSGVLYLTVPLAVDTVVSNLGFGTQSKPYFQALFIIGQIVMACLILQAVITAFQYYISDVIQRRIFARTTADIAYRLPRTRIQEFDNQHGPELVNRFMDVVTAQKNTAFFLLDGINSFMATLIGMILLSLYHPFLLVFVLVIVLLIVVIVLVFGKGAVDSAIIESKSKYSMVSWFEEIATYPTLFKGPGGYELASSRANKLATEYVNARWAHFRIVIRQVTGLLVLSVIAAVILLVGGAWLVISQQITLGQLVASEIIMSSIIASLAKFGKKLEAWYDTMAAMDKLGHIFDLKVESEQGEELPPSKINGGFSMKAENISLIFPDGSSSFQDLSFDFIAGSKIAVIGSYGSGVSGLLDMFFGLRSPDSGYITLDGIDVRDWKLSALRQHVLLLKPDLILGTSIIDNLRLGHDDIGVDEVHHALAKVGLLDKYLAHPEGLNRTLRIGGSQIPKNDRSALLIARAIVHKPKLLIIDELFDRLEETMFEKLIQITLSDEYEWTVLYSTRKKHHTQFSTAVIDLSK